MRLSKLLKSLSATSLALMFVVSSAPADAHPGRLDANGGHYNRKTGEYHYHRSPSSGSTTRTTARKSTPAKKTVTSTKNTTPASVKPGDPQTASSNANKKLKDNHFFLEDEINRAYQEEQASDLRLTDEQRKAIIEEYNSAKATNAKRSEDFGSTIQDPLEKSYYQAGVLRNMMLKACREIAKKYGIQPGDVYAIANAQ